MIDNKIHVVFAVYDPKGTYSRHAGVAMVSMFSNTKSPVCVHILHDETLGGDNRKKFAELAEKFGQEVDFIDVSRHMRKFNIDVDKLTNRFSRGTLFRLFISDVLSIDRVIYLDCDVIVEIDIKELWDIEPGDSEVGAALENIAWNVAYRSKKRMFFCKYTGMDVTKYFNAGVILFNLKKFSESGIGTDLCSEALEFFLRYPDALFYDQDFLNSVFQKNALEIDRKFNYNGGGLDYSDMKGKIWHLMSKPWERMAGLPTDALYWRYLAATPWCRDVIADMAQAWAQSRRTHLHSSDCMKELWLKLKDNFSPCSATLLFKISVIRHDIIYRIRKKFRKK